MASTLFISDLHLSPERPALVEAFYAFMRGPARQADAVYILGDLFDASIGDDQLREPLAKGVVSALTACVQSGVPVYIQHGNRDFLLGPEFARAAGVTLLPSMVVRDLYGQSTLLMHGDLLCTDDVKYQRYRQWWSVPANRRRVLALPYVVRRGILALLRKASHRANAGKPEAIMDVNPAAVAAAMKEHGASRFIHGHTHRPARHALLIDSLPAERWVLADWYDAASYLDVSSIGIEPRSYRAG